MDYWKQKVVVVTGGSDGLGLAIGAAFADRGATVVLVGRDQQKLENACQIVNGALGLSADVTDDQSVAELVQSIEGRLGRIDVWVNNVGKSARTRLLDCTPGQYAELMEINFYTAVRCTLAAMPMLEQSSGLVVNIGSLAAKTGWFHVAPYSASKHALAAFSHQLRIEGPANVSSLFVCPGPIRRDDAGTRYRDQVEGLGEAAAQPGAGVKLKGIPAELVARKIEKAARRRAPELVIPWRARVLFLLLGLWPSLGDRLVRRASGNQSDKP